MKQHTLPTSVIELAHTVPELAGTDTTVYYESARLGDIKQSYADISKAKGLLRFQPRVTLREGLAALV